ncbi:MAG TPA: hypothetical protein IAD19_06820 [Candidatus Egerieicola faecale]|uniref:Polysaccharide chain length determinant N-terminal domain-containing protein n=1 Tax=Candidatus Egerieicola faecale TaxID=2840774 RepID=A0A9D1LJV5_9FIRM|nr:hypothetical protein [Candidatus Egerieicola faecale]
MALNKPEPAQEEEDTISITRLLQAVWKRILWVIAAVVIAVAASAIITQFFITPQYQASCWLFVNTFSSDSSYTQNQISATQLQAATQLANTYIQMLRSETVLNDVSGELGGAYSPQQLSQMISASAITDTQILVITVTHPDPEQAAQIANAVAQVAPASIQSFVEGSSVTVPQYASVPTAPSSPSMSRNLMIGFLVGLVVGVGAALVAYFLDTRVTQQDNLSEIYGYPLLGIIPNMDSDIAVGYYGTDRVSGKRRRG